MNVQLLTLTTLAMTWFRERPPKTFERFVKKPMASGAIPRALGWLVPLPKMMPAVQCPWLAAVFELSAGVRGVLKSGWSNSTPS